MHDATEQWNQTGKPARVFTEFDYQVKKTKKSGWDRERRVVAKAEHTSMAKRIPGLSSRH
jgi:hypothetical protein